MLLCLFPAGSPGFTLTLFLPNLDDFDDDDFGLQPENGGDDTVVDGKAALSSQSICSLNPHNI